MTVKKALKIIDYIIDKKLQTKTDILSLKMTWNQGSPNLQGLSEAYAARLDNDVELFQILKKQLKPNCTHSKKLHDKDPDGNLYCMDCNLDL